MKKLFTSAICVLAVLLTSITAKGQSQTTPVNCPPPYGVSSCPQSNWAAAYLTTTAGQRVYTGQLQPNTPYYLILEALQPVAPCSSIIVVVFGDGFINDETGQEFDGSPYGGIDVPNGISPQGFPGYPYRVRVKIRTKSGPDFVSQLYFRYRMECAAYPSGSGTVGGNSRVPSAQKQSLVPN